MSEAKGEGAGQERAAMSEGERLGRFDLHVHTTMSDGGLPLDEVIEVARQRGVVIGISDHVSGRNPGHFVSDDAKLRSYLEAIEGAPVLRAAELCWSDPFSEALAGGHGDRFDYLIGSNHGFRLPDGSLGSPWWKSLPGEWAARPQRLMDHMVDNICELITQMPIALIAHPTLTPPALYALDPNVEVWWTEERESRVIEAAVGAGVALEISNRYRLPHDRFLTRAREAGATFTLGSDGHERHQVANLEWALATARRNGIGDTMMYLPERALRWV
jgi:histidinol phosphatase-like PHP family hydrolase